MKSILVTGGSGLVGSAIQEIRNQYPGYYMIFLNSKKCNLLDFNETIKIFEIIKPDIVIHLAACVGGLFKNMSQKVKMIEDNLIINTNVLKASYATGVKRLVACLSTCIFPDLTSYPINETMINNGPPHCSNEGYAYAKRILEIQCKCYNEQFGTNYFCVIPTNIYGKFDNFHLEDSHVVPALIHKCFLAKQNNQPFIVCGTGKPLRQFIYNIDFAKIIMELIEHHESNESIIISPKDEYSIRFIAKTIADYFEVDILFDDTYSDGQYRKTADNSKLMNILPDFTFTDITNGLIETMDWFETNYPNIRI